MSLIRSFQKTAVFISGGGSCLQALLEVSEYQNIKLVVTNKKNILGILKAKRFGVEVIEMNSKFQFSDVHQVLIEKKIQKIFLAGFMKMIPADFLCHWAGHIFNIHPSLLPKFRGLHAFEKSFAAGGPFGVTIHHVIPELDAGEIVLQKKSSLQISHSCTEKKALTELRLTEQHLLREFVQKGFLNV